MDGLLHIPGELMSALLILEYVENLNLHGLPVNLQSHWVRLAARECSLHFARLRNLRSFCSAPQLRRAACAGLSSAPVRKCTIVASVAT